MEFYTSYLSGSNSLQSHHRMDSDFFQKKSKGLSLGGFYSFSPKTPLNLRNPFRIEILAGIDSLYSHNKRKYQGGTVSLEQYQFSFVPGARFVFPYFFIEPFLELRIIFPILEHSRLSNAHSKVEFQDPRFGEWNFGLRTWVDADTSVLFLYLCDPNEKMLEAGLGYSLGVSYDI